MQVLPPEKPETPDDSRKAAIGFLILCHRMQPAIAQLRLTEFCDQHNLIDQSLYRLLREGKFALSMECYSVVLVSPKRRKQTYQRSGMN